MSLHTNVCFVVVGTFIASLLVRNECRKLDGYKFPVYTTVFCPRIQTEWIERSSALKCNTSNGYMCLPNENIDQLLEFCYREPVERIQKGICLYLVKRVSLVQSYNCSRFTQGCPNHSFFSNEFFKYPACISIGNGCFLAEPSCKSITPPHIQSTTQQFESILTNTWNGSTTNNPQQSSEHPQLDNAPNNDNDDALFVPILLGIFIPFCFLSLLCGYYIKRKYQICETNGDVESSERENNEAIQIVQIKKEMDREEIEPLIGNKKHDNKVTDSREEDSIKALTNSDQQIIGSSESHEGKEEAMAVQACQNGHDSTVQLLLSNGADINLCEEDGAGPLYIACQNGHDSTVQLLLSNGADINLCKKNGASHLYIACQNGHDSTVQLLLSNGADINLYMEDGTSPLYIACQNGHDSIVQLLLRKDINLCKKNGAGPLYIACQNGHDSTVQLLLSNGADINLCMENGAGPLHIACQNGHEGIVQLLLSNGADINLCKKNGAGPLYIACQNGHDSTVQLLLSNGADINLCMEDGAGPLYIPCQEGHDSTVQLLLSNGADINLCNKNGASHLYIACLNGHDSTVQLLLSNGADINLCNKNGTGPLYKACQKGHDSTVQLLLSNGADINLCNKNGAGPLYIACQNGHDSIVQLLLSNGADINLCNNDGVSILFIAFVWRHYKTVNILLNNGVDTGLACGWEVNPTLRECFDKYESTVEFLMQKNTIQNNLYDPDSYFSLFVSCQVERVTRMIFKNKCKWFYNHI